VSSDVMRGEHHHSPNFLDTPHICDISRLRVKVVPRNLEYWWIPAVGNSSVSFHILISTETHAERDYHTVSKLAVTKLVRERV
jgi:hypothetical protein